MANLTATAPSGWAKTSIGSVTIEALDYAPMTSIAPFPGRDASPALAALGLKFPQPGDVHASGAARIVWFGREQALLIGAEAPAELAEIAALTDQTDAWAWAHMSGADASAVLARLCPLDLREHAFAPGRVARSTIGHMQAVIIRTMPDAYEIAVFRSMAGTLFHELDDAARHVAARARL